MARTITIYGADTDTSYSKYFHIHKDIVNALPDIVSKTISVYDVLEDEEMIGENTEYIDGELSTNRLTRRQWDIECEPFFYTPEFEGVMNLSDLYQLRMLLKRNYLWVDLLDYQSQSQTSFPSNGINFYLPVAYTGHKLGANKEKGIRTFDFTLKHRWENDRLLGSAL